jgi:hypothetical protein
MKINWMRASSYKTYKDCPFKYFLHHDVGIESIAGKKANLGTIVHWVLEQMAKAKRINRHEKHPVLLDPARLLEVAWKRYTGLYPNHDYKPADKRFCAEQINAVLDTDYHPYNLNVLSTEKQFELKIGKPFFEDFGIRGTIDLITAPAENTLEVIDYKTGERKDWITGEELDVEKLHADIQFRVYDLAVRKIYPQFKNYMYTMYFTRNGGPFTVTFTDEDRVHTYDILYKAQQQIRGDESPKRLKDDRGRMMESWKCRSVCQFGKTFAVIANEVEHPENIILEYLTDPPGVGDIIERNDTVYIVTEVYSQCDYFHAFKPYSKTSAAYAKELISLTVKGEAVSARNDYNNPKIFKGEIK